jgi:cytochrome b
MTGQTMASAAGAENRADGTAATTAATVAAATATSTPRVLIWDWPVRVFHWLAVLCFGGAWLSAESERWHLLHISLGYTLGGLVAFRLVWGLIGSRHARFSAFVRGPAKVRTYVASLLAGRPEHHVGHNPAGAWAIVGLLALIGGTVATGWASEQDLMPAGFDALHEAVATGLMVLVGVHVAGVLLGSWLHRENLLGAMLSGRKRAAVAQGLKRSGWPEAGLLIAAVLGFWAWQWQAAPGQASGLGVPGLSAPHGMSDDDGDDE